MSSTRKIVAFNRVSADGYFTTPDGHLDWVIPEDELDKAGAGGASQVDALLFGRRTYEAFESFWPHVGSGATAPDPHLAGRQSPEIRAMADFINETTKFVFSKTRKDVTWKGSRLIHDFDPREIEAMKRQPGKDMMIFGSGTITSLLTEHGLIDEYQFVVGPILLGNGRPLIGDVSKRMKLELLEAKSFPSGNVRLRYARTG